MSLGKTKTIAVQDRILKLQKRIHTAIRADVRKIIGEQTGEIRKYYDAYKREFNGSYLHADKEELLKECFQANVVLFGDYHTFAQSQKAALTILNALLEKKKNITIALEMVQSVHQPILDEFLTDKINEDEFLERSEYSTNWGFPWEEFKKFLLLAKEHGLPVIALNTKNPRLLARDQHAAEIISSYLLKSPDQSIFTLYGDLHLAKRHLPKLLKNSLRENKRKTKILTVFQNSETLYWRLASEKKENNVEVLKLSKDRFCIINAAPWVKLQSYLEWAESSQLLDPEELTGTYLHDLAHARIKDLCQLLGIQLESNLDFTIQTLDELKNVHPLISKLSLKREEVKTIKYHIFTNRTVLISELNIVYLSSKSVNSLAEGVSMLLHGALAKKIPVYYDPKEHFFGFTLASMLAYFGSKILNHKRKCDLEDDYRNHYERKLPRHALPREKLQKKIAKQVLRYLNSEKTFLDENKYRQPSLPQGPGRISVFLETARCLGLILGEKLYLSFTAGKVKPDFIIELFKDNFEDKRKAKKTYLNLLEKLNNAPLQHTSKNEKF